MCCVAPGATSHGACGRRHEGGDESGDVGAGVEFGKSHGRARDMPTALSGALIIKWDQRHTEQKRQGSKRYRAFGHVASYR